MITIDHQLALKPGYVLEGFQIERVLGKGGFGITYLAVDVRLGKRVAIKELMPDSIATRVEGSMVSPQSSSQVEDWQWAKERFVEEARMLAGFSHPAIVGVHLLLEANGTAYMVMDYLEGESYEAKLRRIGSEPDEAALMAVIGPVLEGLEQVHQRGLLHRDIKPDNILIKQNGQPVLIDFGAARESVGKTVTMTSIVSHGYSPIEQYQSKGRMGPWTDIYAVGAVMCRAMTGEKPPLSTDRIVQDDFVWLSHRGLGGFSAAFLNAADWALRVRSEERPPSVADWRRSLGGENAFPVADGDSLVTESTRVAGQIAQETIPLSPAVTSDDAAPVLSGRKTTSHNRRIAIAGVAAAILLAAGWGAVQLMQSRERNAETMSVAYGGEPREAPEIQAEVQATPAPTPAPTPEPSAPAPPLHEKLISVEGGTLPDESALRGTQVAAFSISPHEISLGEWKATVPFAREHGYDIDAEDGNSSRPEFGPPPHVSREFYGSDPQLPVSYVSWFDAVKWCNAKSEQDGLTPVYYVESEVYRSGQQHPVLDPKADGYRLPTSAEWEWAAQGGAKTRGYRYSGSDDIDEVAWIRTNSEGRPQPVGTKAANELGLFDMSGNLMEWCAEAEQESLRARFRGGYWFGAPDMCGIRIQGWGNTDSGDNMNGFRVARSVPAARGEEDTASRETAGKVVAYGGKALFDQALNLDDWTKNPGNEAEFMRLLRESADQGYPPAQFMLAQELALEDDYSEALSWYHKAADQGYGAAQMALGWAFWVGNLGVKADISEATRWFSEGLPNCRKEALAGDVNSQRFLGMAYLLGIVVPQDMAQASKWLQMAADQGDQAALDTLKEMRR